MNSVFEPTNPQTNSETPETSAGTTPVAEPSANREPAAKPRRPRGFAAMDRTKVSEIASKGGKAAHAAGTAHQFTSDEARAAGKKGGVAPHVRRGRGPRQSATIAIEPSPSSKEAKSA